MKFHTDEHVAEAIAVGLRRRGFDVTTTTGAGLVTATDAAQLAYCYKERRVMVTHDSDMLRLSSAGAQHCGIAYCHPTKYKIGGLVRPLLALAHRVPEEEMVGRIE